MVCHVYPQLDKERGNYDLKEISLARIYSNILGLPKHEAERLQHYKNPKLQPEGDAAGNFVAILVSVLNNRCREDSVLSVMQVNQYLDQLANFSERKNQQAVFSRLIAETTLVEQKWIVRIILKDLKLGIGYETILKTYSSNALTLYNITSDLKEALAKNECKHALKVFMPIRPMLAEKVSLKSLQEFVNTSVPVLIETKFDGERIQCHFSEGTVQFFSRGSVNYTHIYGPKMGKIIQQNVSANTCILDGEMVVWDNSKNALIPFGQNKPVAGSENSSKQLCYMVFDILHFYKEDMEGGGGLLSIPLEKRKELLLKTVKPVPHVLEVVKGKTTSKLEEVYSEFNGSIARNEEGIILKEASSLYRPNERTGGWVKLKSEYIDSLGDTLDLLIIGGYFGEAKRAGNSDWTDHVSMFLLGVVDKTHSGKMVYPFCRVGTGYTIAELTELRTHLKDKWRQYDPRMPPKYFGEWTAPANIRPNLFIENPETSIVLEVKAAEINKTNEYPTGYTLRFPRVQRIRYDKTWDQVLNTHELMKTIQDFQEGGCRLKKKHKMVEDVIKENYKEGIKRYKMIVVEAKSTIVEHLKLIDFAEIKQRSRIFKGLEICIVNKYSIKDVTKCELEKMILEHRGKVVANFIPATTTHIIAEKYDFKAQNIAKETSRPIIHYSWLLKCVHLEKLVDLSPKYVLYAPAQMLVRILCSQECQKEFAETMDKYGDNYEKDISLVELKEIMQGMSGQLAEESDDRIVWRLIQMKEKYANKLGTTNTDLFQEYTFFLNHFKEYAENDNKTNELLLTIRRHGGRIVNHINDLSTVTFVINHAFGSKAEKSRILKIAKEKGIAVIRPSNVIEMAKSNNQLDQLQYVSVLVMCMNFSCISSKVCF
eukprot:TRINITY_DN64553_c0_g1_i1.p1 TRINITY_DN64553_c0_g1~~TRINITY_DN64553_c0_g1_i1.p1  ORF type:complete len:880 (-),score=84.68 TRINITY_DN64553_c0_g1_i1:2791-5430(-)